MFAAGTYLFREQFALKQSPMDPHAKTQQSDVSKQQLENPVNGPLNPIWTAAQHDHILRKQSQRQRAVWPARRIAVNNLYFLWHNCPSARLDQSVTFYQIPIFLASSVTGFIFS